MLHSVHLINENDSNQNGEILFSESCYVAYESTCINSNHNKKNNCNPGTDPKSKKYNFYALQFGKEIKSIKIKSTITVLLI